MNKAILIGRLTRDPELRYTSSNRAVCQFTVAIDRPFTNQASGQREADFINVVAWDKTGENVGKYMTKGRLIAVEGRIQTRSYDDNNGQKRYVTEVVADNVEFLSSKNSSNSSNGGSNSQSSDPTPYDFGPAPEPKGTNVDSNPFADFGASIEVSDDELPF